MMITNTKKGTLYFIVPRFPYRFVTDIKFMREIINKKGFSFPLSLTSLINLTDETQWDIVVTDENISQINYDIRPSLVVLSAMTCYFERAVKIAQIFKQKNVPSICGGIHVSLYKNIKDHPFSSIAIGEGEDLWKQILDDHRNGVLKSLYHNDQHSPLVEINAEKVGRYIDFSKYTFYSIQATRGCPYDCNFCAVKEFNGRETRHRKIESIINEIEYAKKTNNDFFFVDDNIIGDKKYAKDLFEALAKQNIFWISQFSINIAFEKDLLELVASSGCEYLFLGVESAQKESLQLFNKKVNLSYQDKYNEVFSNIRSHGIEIMASFIIGNDSDNRESFTKLIDFIESNNILMAMINILTPLPGTKLFHAMSETSRIIDYDFTHYDAQHAVYSPTQMSSSDLERGLCLIYQEIYNFKSLFRHAKAALSEYMFFSKRNASGTNISFSQIIINLKIVIRLPYQLLRTNSFHVLIERMIFVLKMLFLLFDNKVRVKKNILIYILHGISLNDFSRQAIKQIQRRV
jgi:radical SAM superfamily enzyme YgiQ (UPF0313 family)